MEKRFQNKIAESRFALTGTIAASVAVWVLAGLGITPGGWSVDALIADPARSITNPGIATLGCALLGTWLMAELNNTQALIRIYSRMVSCTFLILIALATFRFTAVRPAVVTLCAIGFYSCLFHCYQDNKATGWMFYAYACLGTASIFFVQVLFFLPLLWLLTATKMLAMSAKTFCASLLGLIVPYWLLLAWLIATGQTTWLVSHFASLAQLPVPSVQLLPDLSHLLTDGYVLLLSFIGIIHYLRNRQQDRIRTQMMYETIIIVDIFAIIFLLLQPQHEAFLYGIVVVNTSPLFAHFTALTETRWTNLATKVLLTTALVLTACNLWMLWSVF